MVLCSVDPDERRRGFGKNENGGEWTREEERTRKKIPGSGLVSGSRSLLHCHHQNDFCIKMGNDESHFNVS